MITGITRTGLAALFAGALLLALGVWLQWAAFGLIGAALLLAVLLGLAVVLRPSRLLVERAIVPPRVPKGEPAIAVLSFANRGRRTVGETLAEQPFGDAAVRTVIPRLRGGERGMRTYRLPTRRRGVFDVGPVQVIRRDPLALFRSARRHGHVERIWVYPRLLSLRPLPTGQTRHLEGPSSDTSPHGTITFHRLREYVVGDDLRLVHWRSSARTGRLVVRHNVDTSLPFTVVVLDLRPDRYTAEAFEEAVDVAASVVMAHAGEKAPVELRLSDGTVLGGPRLREPTPLVDHLTAVVPDAEGSLATPLLALRRLRGGTSLVVVTGTQGVDTVDDLAHVRALRRHFDRVVAICLDPARTPAPHHPGVRVISAADADEVAAAWNLHASAAGVVR